MKMFEIYFSKFFSVFFILTKLKCIIFYFLSGARRHPFAEHISYLFLFATPLLILVFTKTASMMAVFGYVTYIDFMNNMGHCNFEIVPMWLFNIFPCLKYLMYTPSYVYLLSLSPYI